MGSISDSNDFSSFSKNPFENNAFQDAVQNIHEVTDVLLRPIKSIEPLTQTLEECIRRCEEISDIVNRAIPESLRKALSFFDELGESIARVQEKYSKIFDSISIPSFDDIRGYQSKQYSRI